MMYGSNYSGTVNYGMSGYSGSTGYSGGASYSGNSSYTGSFSPQTYALPETPHMSLAEGFLAENRPWTPLISDLGDVKEVVEQTYEKLTGQNFPHDSIMIKICDEQTFRITHLSTGGSWSDGIMGFSYNKYGKGMSEIYIRQDHLDSVLLTIGHEIGHVLSSSLPNKHDEEAKAHAFSLAWVETIREHNIGGLTPNIAPNPAHNGLHDVAFDFVKQLLHTGSTSFDIFKTLAHGLTSIIAEVH